MAIESRNPATEEVIEVFEALTSSQVDARLENADRTFLDYRKTSFVSRTEKMLRVAEILEKEASQIGRLLTEEMGKTLLSAVAEVEKCAWVCRFYAENAEKFLADETIASSASRSFICYLPIGPVLAVMPWNFPFWQVFRFAAPSLMAGNVALLKHASNVPRSALAIEEIFRRAEFPEGVFQTLLIGSDQVEDVLKDPRVRAVTLTGSEAAGAAVAATAGREIKKSVMELGGSDAFIVMPSADLEKAVNTAVLARIVNNGQSCVAAKRFLIHRDIYDDFLEQFKSRFAALKTGDPTESDTDVGPLATSAILDELDDMVEATIEAGATRVVGAKRRDGTGFFYEPGILADIPNDAPAFSEELFGPVALVFKVEDIDDAISLANATRFGLGSAIFTNDKKEIERAATEIEAGATFVNALVASDPRLPFGGVKASGYGRELARAGILEFVNIKTISIT